VFFDYYFKKERTFAQTIINNTKRIMKELVEKISALVADFSKDANAQIENGNKAAGTRARKASLEIEKAMKEFRKASLEASKN
jgi:hypothetical protein